MKKIEAKKIFNGNADFILGAHNFSQIPDHHYPEIAFIGASNTGKSSLINSLIGKKIAIVSSTPGRTRQLNFFKISGYKDGFVIVDMPGYGFAKAKEKHIAHWQKTSFLYLTKRANLKRVFLLIDIVKGIKENDQEAINIFNSLGVSFQIIFTKIDKLSLEKQKTIIEKNYDKIKDSPALYPQIIATSSSKKYGIEELQNTIVEILQNL